MHRRRPGVCLDEGTTVLTGAATTPSNSTYSITSIATTDSGAYTCKITNATSASATASFELIAVPAPVITAQPAGKGIALGSNYTMSVSATGSYLSYFWSQIGTNTNTCSVGGNTNKLTISGAEYTNAGTYSVIVSNLTASVTSTVANITVQQAAAISLQPNLTRHLADQQLAVPDRDGIRRRSRLSVVSGHRGPERTNGLQLGFP